MEKASGFLEKKNVVSSIFFLYNISNKIIRFTFSKQEGADAAQTDAISQKIKLRKYIIRRIRSKEPSMPLAMPEATAIMRAEK